MNMNFAIIFRILSIDYAFVTPKLKPPVIISYVALCFLKKEWNSLKASIISKIIYEIIAIDDIVNISLYGSSKYSFSTNNKILSFTVEFLESTKRFDKPLFWITSIAHGNMKSFHWYRDKTATTKIINKSNDNKNKWTE